MLNYIFLGIIQGLTEFLPVSSSGHLVLLQHVLDIKEQQLLNVIVLHLGTVFSLIVFLFRDILKAIRDLRLMFNIFIVTIITGLIAILGQDYFESVFSSVKMVSISLLITGIVLALTKRFQKNNRDIKQVNLKDALILGFTQAIAIIPGISRSGITISSLLFRKIDKGSAFKFSFLASIPAVVGAFILKARELNLDFSLISPMLFIGFISAFISGLLALYLLRIALNKAKLFYFGYYCILISILSWIFLS